MRLKPDSLRARSRCCLQCDWLPSAAHYLSCSAFVRSAACASRSPKGVQAPACLDEFEN